MDGAQQGAVAESGSTVYLAEVINHAVGYLLGVYNLHVVAYLSAVRHLVVDVGLDELSDLLLQFLVGEVLHHEGGKLTVQIAEENDVSFSHLVEHAHQVALTVGCSLGGFHGRDVRDVAIIPDVVVVDEIAYVLDEAVITYGCIAQGGIVDARVLYEALAHLYILVEGADVYFAVEHHAVHEVRFEIF